MITLYNIYLFNNITILRYYNTNILFYEWIKNGLKNEVVSDTYTFINYFTNKSDRVGNFQYMLNNSFEMVNMYTF